MEWTEDRIATAQRRAVGAASVELPGESFRELLTVAAGCSERDALRAALRWALRVIRRLHGKDWGGGSEDFKQACALAGYDPETLEPQD